jgi:predicted oxidoreductase
MQQQLKSKLGKAQVGMCVCGCFGVPVFAHACVGRGAGWGGGSVHGDRAILIRAVYTQILQLLPLAPLLRWI